MPPQPQPTNQQYSEAPQLQPQQIAQQRYEYGLNSERFGSIVKEFVDVPIIDIMELKLTGYRKDASGKIEKDLDKIPIIKDPHWAAEITDITRMWVNMHTEFSQHGKNVDKIISGFCDVMGEKLMFSGDAINIHNRTAVLMGLCHLVANSESKAEGGSNQIFVKGFSVNEGIINDAGQQKKGIMDYILPFRNKRYGG